MGQRTRRLYKNMMVDMNETKGDIMDVYYCPKCNSEDIETICINPPQKNRISMDKIKDDKMSDCIDAVHIIYRYILQCKKCGYKVEFAR